MGVVLFHFHALLISLLGWRFREEGLRVGAWQGCAGRGGDGEDQGNEVKSAPEARDGSEGQLR